MTKFLFKALQTILRSLIGALNYERVKLLVSGQEGAELSGAEKRDLVAQEARSVGKVGGRWRIITPLRKRLKSAIARIVAMNNPMC